MAVSLKAAEIVQTYFTSETKKRGTKSIKCLGASTNKTNLPLSFHTKSYDGMFLSDHSYSSKFF